MVSDYIGGEGPNSGGAGHATLDSFRALRAAGADVRVIAGFGGGGAIEAGRFATLGGSDLRAGGAGDMIRAIYNPVAERALAAALAGEDPATTLVILHQWTRYLSPAALRVATRFPLMIYMHDYFWTCPNGLYYDFREQQPCTRQPMQARCLVANCDRHGRLQKLGRVARQAGRQIASRGDPNRRLFLHLSGQARRTAAPLLPGEHHVILHNPLPPADRPAHPPAAAPIHDIGYFGRLESDKGVDLLIDAIATLGRTGLFVGEGSLQPRLAAIPRIIHRCWQTRDTMAAAMRSCRVVVLPSRWNETWGLIVPEAMAAGVPVLVSCRAGAAELVERFGGGRLFDPGRPEELAAQLTDMLAAAPVPTPMGEQLAAFLSPERHAARLLGLAERHFGLDLQQSPRRVSEPAASPAPQPA